MYDLFGVDVMYFDAGVLFFWKLRVLTTFFETEELGTLPTKQELYRNPCKSIISRSCPCSNMFILQTFEDSHLWKRKLNGSSIDIFIVQCLKGYGDNSQDILDNFGFYNISKKPFSYIPTPFMEVDIHCRPMGL